MRADASHSVIIYACAAGDLIADKRRGNAKNGILHERLSGFAEKYSLCNLCLPAVTLLFEAL